jgi:GLPGLI family protein
VEKTFVKLHSCLISKLLKDASMNINLLPVILFVFSITPNVSHTQTGKANTVEAKIAYTMITNLRGNKIEQPAELIIRGQESVFVYSKGKEGLATVEVEIKQPDGSFSKGQDGYWQDSVGSVFYKNFAKKQLFIREIVWMQPYLTKEPQLPSIKWAISAEQKKINNFDCQKATATFRGRNYTAWFTTQIPCNDGPWKLQGLPGLILEAYDDKEEVKFVATQIDIPHKTTTVLKPKGKGIKVSFKDYKRADDMEFEKMQRKSMSNMDRSNNVEIKRVNKNLLEKEYEY